MVRPKHIFHSLHPATGKTLKQYRYMTPAQLLTAFKQSQQAFSLWKETSVDERAKLLQKLGSLLKQQKESYARMITLEMGKPHVEAVAEIEKCVWACEYFASQGPRFLQPEMIKTEAKKSYARFDPLGVLLAIMPWNFPFWQVFRFGAPALLAGNTILLKHSSIVPGCSLLLEKLFQDAGFPSSVFQTLLTDADGVALLLPHVQGVTLTGSVAAGSTIGGLAGKHLKPFVLELGGSDPFIVLDDADVVKAAEAAVKARFANNGQSCIAAKRFFVVKSVASQFIEEVVKRTTQLRVGNPIDPETQIGPLARDEQVKLLEKQLKSSVQQGAKIACGGKRLPGYGYFFAPTVLIHVKSSMAVMQEETFGPVLPIMVVKDAAEALRLANASSFGLGASVWTKNIQQAEFFAQHLDVGFVAVNAIVKSDPRLPFGGVKNSGMGRELSRYGLLEFCNVKTVVTQ